MSPIEAGGAGHRRELVTATPQRRFERGPEP